MTEYGTPYEGERKKGEKTSEVLGKKAKKDYDGDGKIESGAKEHAGAVKWPLLTEAVFCLPVVQLKRWPVFTKGFGPAPCQRTAYKK